MRPYVFSKCVTSLMFGVLAVAVAAFAAGAGENGAGDKVPEGYLGGHGAPGGHR